jgi:hypothetical protein
VHKNNKALSWLQNNGSDQWIYCCRQLQKLFDERLILEAPQDNAIAGIYVLKGAGLFDSLHQFRKNRDIVCVFSYLRNEFKTRAYYFYECIPPLLFVQNPIIIVEGKWDALFFSRLFHNLRYKQKWIIPHYYISAIDGKLSVPYLRKFFRLLGRSDVKFILDRDALVNDEVAMNCDASLKKIFNSWYIDASAIRTVADGFLLAKRHNIFIWQDGAIEEVMSRNGDKWPKSRWKNYDIKEVDLRIQELLLNDGLIDICDFLSLNSRPSSFDFDQMDVLTQARVNNPKIDTGLPSIGSNSKT